MNNPFENPDGSYFVLMNQEGQYSLWPDFRGVPAGWKIVYGSANREDCMNYITFYWHDLIPNSLKSVEKNGSRS
ncbi:MbtH family protein [Lentibacillus sp. N15]|uniref:MbtH family protein n=1 Tax=Lentibacillus songyuanensis TaxID=3136161 RepID=UPI0031BA2961